MTSEVLSTLAELNELNESNRSENSVQSKLVIREGHLRVEQVSAEIKSTDVGDIKLDTSNISAASETQTAPEKPDLVTLMGGFEDCKAWLLSYVASANQYQRNENDIYNKVKREFSVFTEKDEVVRELRNVAAQIDLLDIDEDGSEKMYRTANGIRYLTDSCITLHFFMKGSGGVERIIKENHKLWYEDQSWEELGLSYECFYKILKGKVYKAMNGAIANKYSSWPGVKEFAQKNTYSANNHQMKFTDLYRIMKKDFAAPHDIIRHMKMEDVLDYSVNTIPGLKLTGHDEDKKVVTDPEVIELVKKVKHLTNSGVKNLSKEFAAFHPNSKDWTSYHMTYQKLNHHFRNVLNPSSNRRRSKNTAQEEPKAEISSMVLDSSSKHKHNFQAIAINTVNEKKRHRTEEERHVTYNERGEQTRTRSNSVAERDENTTVYMNTEKRSVATVIGLPGTGKTTTLATMLGKAHNKDNPSTVLIISSNCCTTQKLLEYTSCTFIKACPAVNERTRKQSESEKGCCAIEADNCSDGDSGDSFIVHDEVSDASNKSSDYEKLDKPYSPDIDGAPVLEDGEIVEKEEENREAEEKRTEEAVKIEEAVIVPPAEAEKPVAEEKKPEEKLSSDSDPKEKTKKTKHPSAESKAVDEFEKTELPWMVYHDVSEILNASSEGKVTVIHFPNYEEMDAEVVCAVLEKFMVIPSKVPKLLLIDNLEVMSHPCNSGTLDKVIEQHRETNMSVWVAGTTPQNLPINLLDYATLSILHQFTSKYWYSELADHLALTSVTFQHCQGLSPGQCVMVAPGAHMQHPVHSSSFCYPCTIVTPRPINYRL